MHASASSSALCLLTYKEHGFCNMENTYQKQILGFTFQIDSQKSKAAMPVDLTSTKLKLQSVVHAPQASLLHWLKAWELKWQSRCFLLWAKSSLL